MGILALQSQNRFKCYKRVNTGVRRKFKMEYDRFKIDKTLEFPQEMRHDTRKKIHFIGLGGIGMSGLAKFLLELGYKVSGSDIKDGPTMFSISAQGGTVFIGHVAENVGNADLVVVSSAIKATNPELIEAQNRNLPIIHRSHVLEALMSGLGLENKHISIGVAGTHGKTTTTGMISLIFEDAKLNPSIVVGGQLPYLNTNSKLGDGKYFIAELDESDGSIELYSPDMTVITNTEEDHLDYYTGGFQQLLETFIRYVNNLDKGSRIIINADCSGNRELIAKVNHPGIILYSCNPECELYNEASYTIKTIAVNGLQSGAEVYKNNEFIGNMILGVPGIHNISNALAAMAVAMENGIEFEQAAGSLARFTGMKRRFQVLGTVNGAKIIDDYAHHPTEIKATLNSAKDVVKATGKGRVVAIFQPHRYSRLSGLWNDFLNSFKDADVLYICDVYPAGEKPLENISTERLCKELVHPNVHYIEGPVEQIPEKVCSQIKPDDLVLTIGAGDITKLGHIVIEKMGLDRKICV